VLSTFNLLDIEKPTCVKTEYTLLTPNKGRLSMVVTIIVYQC